MPSTGSEPQSSAELTKFVQNLLNQMQTRFQTMSDSIIGRIDEMGGRIDELEKSIGDLVQQAGVDEAQKGPRGSSAQ
jgi:heat shock factor-binding protein 1